MSDDVNDRELQLAIELSKKTYDEEERRRNHDVDLIRFESPQEIQQREKISRIRQLISQTSLDSGPSTSTPQIGWRSEITHSIPTSPTASFAQIPQTPSFPTWHTFEPSTSVPATVHIPPPPLPPRSSLNHRSRSSGTLADHELQPPPLPPKRQSRVLGWKDVATTSPASNLLDTALGTGNSSFLSQTPQSILHYSGDVADSSFSFTSPSSRSAHNSSQYDYLNADLYVPFSTMSKNLVNGDLIDFGSPGLDDSEIFTLEQIRQEFDPLFYAEDSRLNETVIMVAGGAPAPSSPTPAIAERVPAIKATYQDSDDMRRCITLEDFEFEKHVPSPIKQVLIVKEKGLKKLTDSSLYFKAFTADFSTTSAESVKVVIYTDHTFSVMKNFPRTVDAVSTTAEMITTEILVDLLPEDKLAHGVPSSQYGLKVYGLDEFLPAHLPLGHNVYVGKCLLHGKDVKLEIGPLTPAKQARSTSPTPPYERMKSHVKYPSVLDAEDAEQIFRTLGECMKSYEKDFHANSVLSISASSSKVKQCIRLLCTHLNSVVPVNLYGHLQNYLTAGTEAQMLSAKSDFLASLHSFVSVYCKSTMSLYNLQPLTPAHKEVREILHCTEKLRVVVNSIHKLPDEWIREYSEFYMTANVYHGTRLIDGHDKCVAKYVKQDSFFPYLPINQCVLFNHQLCLCPRETKLMFVLHGVSHAPQNNGGGEQLEVKKSLAFTSIPLFDHDMTMRQGTLFASMTIMKDSFLKPWGPHPLIANEKDPVIIVTLPTLDYELKFPEIALEYQSVKQDFLNLSIDTQSFLMDLVEAGEMQKLSQEEQELLWQKRAFLMDQPEALPLVLGSVADWGYLFLPNVYQILEDWAPLSPVQAMQLLLPQYPDERVRKKALEWILRASSDFLFNALPQLVEALRFELFENSALAICLLTLSYTDRRFAFEIYWQLQQRIDHCVDFAYAQRCTLLQKELLERHESDQLRYEIAYQHRLLNDLDCLQMDLRAEDSDQSRNLVLRTRLGLLDSQLLQKNVRLPIIPSFKCSGIAVTECGIFNSNAKPLRIVFRGLTSTYSVIHKTGDDMRQDAMVLQLVSIMNDIWLSEGLDLRVILFRCMPVGYKKGMAELVSDCSTLCDIQKEGGVTGVFKDDVLINWIQKYNSSEFLYQVALDNFTRSCAAWCVATYVLGIGDRHNDNILVTTAGHVFHIDFGKYMGDWQTAGGFRRDRVPFVFTVEMYHVINRGTEQQESYQTFIDYCCRAFNYIRRKYAVFINILKIMACSDIPGVTIESLAFVEKNLMLELSETDAVIQFTELINASLTSAFPRINFFIHTIAQMISGSNTARSNDNALSFVPQLYSQHDDGKILDVKMITYEKRLIPNKVYLYKMQVVREGQNVSTIVYRTFDEFNELYIKLRRRFPSMMFPALSTGTHMRSNVREVAQRRMVELEHFIRYLFSITPEISHCNLVYTFFHLILRDSNIDSYLDNDSNSSDIRTQCQVFLKIHFSTTQRKLSIFVGHVKQLALLNSGQPPDAYVKTYIRPDTQNLSKRKTQVVRCSQNPTFNKKLFYDFRLENSESLLATRVLEISVWNSSGLMDNHKMYMVYLPLQKLKMQPEDRKGNRVLEGWYTCERVSS